MWNSCWDPSGAVSKPIRRAEGMHRLDKAPVSKAFRDVFNTCGGSLPEVRPACQWVGRGQLGHGQSNQNVGN